MTNYNNLCFQLARSIAAGLVIGFQVGSATNAFAAPKVGTAAAVNTDAYGAAPGSARKAKLMGDNVFYNERIETSKTGLVQVLLNDGSTFTVGANSDLVIDEFVYDPDSGAGQLVATLSKGVARFVGGKLSKKRGGVTVNTPVGTIGIRGGIANLDVSGDEPVFSLVFGEELTYSSFDGSKRRIYQPGYSLQIGEFSNQIRRLTQVDMNSFQSGLQSAIGQSGGAVNKPTGEQVERSGITEVNSGLGEVETAPRDKPQSVKSTSLLNVEDALVQIQVANSQRTLNEIDAELPQDAPAETVDVRVLTAGTYFSPIWDQSRVVAAPGAQGLIGGSSGLNQNVPFELGEVTAGDAGGLVIGTVEGNEIYQFVFQRTGGYFYSQTYNEKGRVAQNGDFNVIPELPTLEGNVTNYAWGAQYNNIDFGGFAHVPNIVPGANPAFDIENMIIGIWGIGTDFDNFGNSTGSSSVRSYSLTTDPTIMFALGSNGADGGFVPFETQALFVNPLVATELGTDFLSEVHSTDLLLIENSSATLDAGHFLASSFLIDGSEFSQKSLISLAVGDVYLENSGGYGVMSTGRRGGHRVTAEQSAGLYGGALGTVAGPDGSEFFGPNAQSFVIGNDLSSGSLDDPYSDNYAHQPADITREDRVSAGLHVGALDEVNVVPVNTLSRTDQTISGYASGSLESSANFTGQNIGAIGFASASPSDLTMTFNSSEHTLGGSLTVRDTKYQDPEIADFTVRFGFNSDGSKDFRAAFIDDDTYAARDAENRSETYVYTDSEVKVEHHSGQNPNTYVIPSTLVTTADDAIMAVATECTCAFLEWGYWGTQMNYNDSSDALEEAANRHDAFHLGTWVAGDVTNSSALPTTGSASYAGHAVGNVINNNSQYLAAGNFNMTVDFGRRTGSASVTGFDGRSFGAELTEHDIASGNHFAGAISEQAITGTMNTSIVGGPNSNHQGAIGNFNAADGNWAANGIVAGELQ